MLKMLSLYCRHSAKNVLIWQFILQSINRNGHMTWPKGTVVQVPVIFRDQINIVEYETGPVVVLDCFTVADVQKSCSIKFNMLGLWTKILKLKTLKNFQNVFPHFFDDVDGVVQLLFLQEFVHVVEKEEKMPVAVTIGDYDRHFMSGFAFSRLPVTSTLSFE